MYSPDEKRALVLEHLMLPHGQKGKFLADRGLSRSRMSRWRSAYSAGTLEYGLVPRGRNFVDKDEMAALRRLAAENDALKAKLAEKDEELQTQRRVSNALGKAIEILHQSGSKTSNDSTAASEFRDWS